jgi:ATP-dependent helicase/nuclease subunit B
MSAAAYLGRLHFDLEDALVDRIASVRGHDPFAPITVLVGSNTLGLYLRRRLAERAGGLFNVRFTTFADLARSIARAGPGGTRRMLPSFAGQIIVEELLRDGDGASSFGEVSRTKGFAAALMATFADLSEGGCTRDAARAAAAGPGPGARLSDRARAVLALFARFRERVEALGGDIHSTFLEAIEAPLPRSIGAVVLAYGFYDFNELQWRLIRRLAETIDLTLFVPWGGGEVWRFAEITKVRIEESTFESIVLPVRGGPRARVVKPALLNVAGEEEEIREIARRVLAAAGEGKTRFGDMAILLPSVETYAPLCREILGEAGIPYFMSAGSFAESSSSAKGVARLLRMLSGTMERRELVEFLVSAPLVSPGVPGEAGDYCAHWVRMSAEAGILGERGWIEESAALIERMRSEVERGDEGGEALEAALHVDGLIRRIAEARDAVREASTWAAYAGVVSTLVKDIFRESEDGEIVRTLVEELAELDRIGAPASFDAFSRLVESSLLMRSSPVGRLCGAGINVLSLEQARGLSFRAVFIPGLAERIFPTMPRQDPFLSDEERRELGTITGGAVALSQRCGRLSEEALLFELARSSAREELVCSYPRFEEGTAKERIPSSFLRFLPGYSIEGSHGEALDYEWVPRGGSPVPDKGVLSEHEFDFRKAREYREGGGFLPDNVFFSRGATLVKGRWGARTFTEYDGVFSSKRAIEELRTMLQERGWRFAPTALEAYAACPFDYFCSQVLGVEVLEEPERIVSIAPRSRGILVHQILARVFAELKRERLLPVRDAPAERVFEIAEGVVTEFLKAFPKTEPVGLPVFWEMEKRFVQESIRLLLEEERIEEGDFIPTSFERSFGRERDQLDVSYECGGREIFFYGRIDRIDIGGDGAFRVVDYKTGALNGADQDLAGGTALQLPIYLMAAARMLGRPLEAGEARYLHVGAGPGRNTIVFSGRRWAESEAAFARIMGTITTGIEHGVFLAPAKDQTCRNCAVKMACPAGMPRLFALKAAHDERAAAYLDMRGAGGEER